MLVALRNEVTFSPTRFHTTNNIAISAYLKYAMLLGKGITLHTILY